MNDKSKLIREYAEENGITHQQAAEKLKHTSIHTSIRIPPAIYISLEDLAEKEGLSVTGYINYICKVACKHLGKKEKENT